MSAHTPGPWELGEYSDHLGYDCLTGGVRAGPVVLDGSDYGQKLCRKIEAPDLSRMMADARLIAAAPDLLHALEEMMPAFEARMGDFENVEWNDCWVKAVSAIAKAKGAS